MARIGFLVLYATGHLNPSIAFAHGLQRAGHDVVFFNIPDVQATVETAGLRFVSFAAAEYPPGTLRVTTKKIGELTGAASFAYFIERMSLLIQTSFAYLPALLESEQLDLLVVDQLYPGGATLADYLRIPFISLANALMVNREPTVPPPTLLWPYDPSPAAVERNGKGWAGTLHAFDPLLALVNGQRGAWGLPLYQDFLEDSFSPLAQIAQQPPNFDFPRPALPANLSMVGHLEDAQEITKQPFAWEFLDGRPLIYASLGTLQNRLEHVFRAIIEGCAPLDAQVVVALGKDALAPELFGEIPENILLVPFVPQAELLKRAALCITHAGLNTTLDCLANGVPMVAVPIASEQPGIAMRIAFHGLGKVVPLAEVSAESLRSAVETVLQEPRFRAAAAKAQAEVRLLRPVEAAVQIVGAVLLKVAGLPAC